MGFLRRSKAPTEHPLNAFMAQIPRQASGSSKKVQAPKKDDAPKQSKPQTPRPKRHTIPRKPLRAIRSNTPRKSPVAAPKSTLITTPLKFANPPLRTGERHEYDQETSSWHIIAKADSSPVQPLPICFEMPGAFPQTP
ncbi:hypothetical protein E2P81_ATG05627 [Venturia nashicola]|nr:hypothetical protein E2P81_ATG05627 [Venturia nashicola]